MVTIRVVFTDGSQFQYQVEDMVKAKRYAHLISTGRGCREPQKDGYVYWPLHKIDRVEVIPEGEEGKVRLVEEKES